MIRFKILVRGISVFALAIGVALHGHVVAGPPAVTGEPRAPANCGPTASGIKNIDAWLASAPGGETWDVIHFNFGIHDRNTPLADYSARLEQLVERMKMSTSPARATTCSGSRWPRR